MLLFVTSILGIYPDDWLKIHRLYTLYEGKTPTKRGVLGMTRKNGNAGVLENAEYPLLPSLPGPL